MSKKEKGRHFLKECIIYKFCLERPMHLTRISPGDTGIPECENVLPTSRLLKVFCVYLGSVIRWPYTISYIAYEEAALYGPVACSDGRIWMFRQRCIWCQLVAPPGEPRRIYRQIVIVWFWT